MSSQYLLAAGTLFVVVVAAGATTSFVESTIDHEEIENIRAGMLIDRNIEACYRTTLHSPYEYEDNFNHGKHHHDGEMTFAAVEEMMRSLGVTKQDRFIEVGSGNGKLVLQVAMQHNVRSARGVEIEKTFHDLSNKALNCLIVKRPSLIDAVTFQWDALEDISLHNQSIAYISGLALNNAQLKMLSQKLAELPPGAFVVSHLYIPGDHLLGLEPLHLKSEMVHHAKRRPKLNVYRRAGRSRPALLRILTRLSREDDTYTEL